MKIAEIKEMSLKYNLQSLQDIDNDETLDVGTKYNKINNTIQTIILYI